MSRTLIVITGATAVGKSALALTLAQRLGTAIVSADSRQCYREMTIGTAKPTAEELVTVKHYFINSHTLEDSVTAADYERLALGYLEEIFRERDVAILCGGTGLYVKALCDGLDDMPEVDTAIEERINQEYAEKGIGWLQERVQEEDPSFYGTGEVQNPARLLRALVFLRSTGESITAYRTGVKKERPFNIIRVGLELPRELLYSRINTRVDVMMNEGLLEEVKGLLPHYKQSTHRNKTLATVGYAELFDYLAGKCSLETAVDKIKQHSRNYAKRQMTWFKRDRETRWMDAREEGIVERVMSFL